MGPKFSLKFDAFVIENYNESRPFSSFLPGIAGVFGKPMWVFYTNRGQCISSFGVRNKNGAMLEFYPANKAYAMTPLFGFSGEVSLSIADAPGSSFSPSGTFTTSRLTLRSSPCAPGGQSRVYTITGKSGAIVHTTAVVAIPPFKQTCPDVPAGLKPLPYCP